MNVENIVNQLAAQADQVGQDFQSKLNSNMLNDPAQMLKTQFAMNLYSNIIQFESSTLKLFKDLISGIISKI